MTRRDGDYTTYRVQHRDSRGDWKNSALSHMLFDELPYRDRWGETGDGYRKLLDPIYACWQETGIHAFLSRDDAHQVLFTVAGVRPDQAFRLVVVHETVRTTTLLTVTPRIKAAT